MSSPAQVLQVLQDAGLCSEPQKNEAVKGSETSFGQPGSTTCHNPVTPTVPGIVVVEGVQPVQRDRMARQLTDQHVYVRADEDRWFLVVPAADEKATQAAFGTQLTRLAPPLK